MSASRSASAPPSTTPLRPSGGAGAPPESAGGDTYIRKTGRSFIFAYYAALRAIKLYPVENAAVQKALAELANFSREIVSSDGELEVRVSGEFIFVNATRLRLDLDNYASFSHLLTLFRASGVGSQHIAQEVTSRDWLVFLSLLQTPAGEEAPTERFEALLAKLHAANIHAFTLGPPTEQDDDQKEKNKERAKKTYTQSVAVTKDLMTAVRFGKHPNVKKIKRVVQGIVDQILNEETSLIGLTAIRDYDEYTFTHSVNVCIFSVAIGKRLGLAKLQLFDLGMAALFHDIGKSRVPTEVLNKTAGLTDDEWRLIAAHPWMGVLSLFQLSGSQEVHYRAMMVALEHHMKIDLTGYPRPMRPRQMSMFSKIVAIADGFDAATSRRVYQTVPLNPADVLREMRDNPRRGMDPVLVKAFVNLTGIFPVGTLVVLDTFEIGLVHSVSPIQEMLSRPVVRVVSDDKGNLLFPGYLVDLADRTPEGGFRRTIIKTEDPDRYGIRVGDYFV
jgi:HD-GYP domain-containing protein (c-di-GMP phosphodiesterase class II)